MEEHEIKETFIDGIGNITFIGGMIRADIVSYATNKTDDKGSPLLTTRQRLIFSPQGFVQAVGAMNNIVKKLNEAGIIPAKKEETKNPSTES